MTAQRIVYASFGQRLIAIVLDFIIISILKLMLLAFIVWNIFKYHAFSWFSTKSIFYAVIVLVFTVFYDIYLVKRFGGTPGKLLVGIRITKLDRSPVGWREALLRNSVNLGFSLHHLFLSLLSALMVFSLGQLFPGVNENLQSPSWHGWSDRIYNIWLLSELIVMLTNKRRQALHDMIAGTIVVTR